VHRFAVHAAGPQVDDEVRTGQVRDGVVTVDGGTARRLHDHMKSDASGLRSAPAEKERRALLVAAEVIITEKGFARTTVDEVAQRSGLSAEIFHAHFQGMGGVLRALSQSFLDQMTTVIDQATRSGIWKGAAARDVVEVAVRSILDVVIERKGLVRAFLAHGATDGSLAADLRHIGTHMSQRVIAVLAECTNVPTRPSRAIAFSLLTAVALAHHYILVGDEWSGVSFTKEQLTEEATRAICAYLGLHPTIQIREDSPDAAPTEMIEALKTSEIQVVDPTRRD
jgi:AcrR family transcriptional regulator